MNGSAEGERRGRQRHQDVDLLALADRGSEPNRDAEGRRGGSISPFGHVVPPDIARCCHYILHHRRRRPSRYARDHHEIAAHRRHRLRSASGDAERGGAAAVSRRLLARPAGQPPHRQILVHPHQLSAALAARGAAGLAASLRLSGRRPRDDPPPGARSVRHPLRHLQHAAWRDGAVQRGHGGRLVRGGERLGGEGTARPRAAPARLDPGAGAQSGARRQGDRARRARSPLRAGAAAGDGRDAARAAALLADLCGRREASAGGRHPCRQQLSPCADCRRAGRPIGSRTTSPSRPRSNRSWSASWPKACSRNIPRSSWC